MNKVLTRIGLGVVLAATAVTAAAPAEAQRGFRGGGFHGGYGGFRGGYGGYRGGYRGGIGPGGAAVLGGIVGLGVGAAIASNHGYGYGGGYYGPRGYYGYPGYGYYGYPGYGYYGPRCFTEFRRDYYGYRVPVRVCD